MKTILVLMDTLRRKEIGCYGGCDTVTPVIDSLAEQSTIFCNHWVGSAPCMPARRDLFTGRIEFLERPWGPLEPFDQTFVGRLRENNVYTHIVTDHYHYFEKSGEHYCQQFNSWDFVRGQEMDCYVGKADCHFSAVYPETTTYRQLKQAGVIKDCGVYSEQYLNNRTSYEEEGFPVKRVFSRAAEWVRQNCAEDFFLMVESFSPHEPFDCPDYIKEKFGEKSVERDWYWPSYHSVTESQPQLDRLRLQYKMALYYADRCLGEFVKILKETGVWDDCCFILTTDHGHMLGEHDYTGKNTEPFYNEMAHIPLLVHMPGQSGSKQEKSLTQIIDIYPTILQLYGINVSESIHGKVLPQTVEGAKVDSRQSVIYGLFGGSVNITDGRYTYMKAPVSDANQPLFIYTAQPSAFHRFWKNEEFFRKLETGRFLGRTQCPVFRYPENGRTLKAIRERNQNYIRKDLLFDIQKDYAQETLISNAAIKERMETLLYETMIKHDCPFEQFERLGLR